MRGIESHRLICQKNESENYLLDKFIFRRISIFITIIFIKLKIKANTATFLSLAAALGSCFFLLYNTVPMMAAAIFLIFLYYMLDHVDGELARYHKYTGGRTSLRGHYFDLLVHRYSSNLMVFFMGLGVYNLYRYESVVILGFAACIGMSSFPNVVAAQVLAGKIANDPGTVGSGKTVDSLQRLERKTEQIRYVRGGMAKKFRKALEELLFFPGHIIAIQAVLLADIFSPGFELFSHSLNVRIIFLAAMSLLFVSKSIIQGFGWVTRLKHIE